MKMMAVISFETSGSTRPMTQRHIPEDWNYQLNSYENLARMN
jgi:hypothetical protein